MITETISNFLRDTGQTWTLESGRVTSPSPEDVEIFLDEAVRHLHTEEIGTRLTAGGLIIEKEPNDNYGVYLYAGNFK